MVERMEACCPRIVRWLAAKILGSRAEPARLAPQNQGTEYFYGVPYSSLVITSTLVYMYGQRQCRKAESGAASGTVRNLDAGNGTARYGTCKLYKVILHRCRCYKQQRSIASTSHYCYECS